MNNKLHILSIILLICWAVGLFALNAGPLIHVFLVLSLVSILINIVQNQEA